MLILPLREAEVATSVAGAEVSAAGAVEVAGAFVAGAVVAVPPQAANNRLAIKLKPKTKTTHNFILLLIVYFFMQVDGNS